MQIGDRVRLHITKQAAYPNEIQYDGREAVIAAITDTPHFPIRVQVDFDGRRAGMWVKASECGPIKEDDNDA